MNAANLYVLLATNSNPLHLNIGGGERDANKQPTARPLRNVNLRPSRSATFGSLIINHLNTSGLGDCFSPLVI